MVSGFILGIRVRALGLRVRLVDLNFGVSTGLPRAEGGYLLFRVEGI